MSEKISRQKFNEIMSPKNKDEKLKRRFTKDWARGKVDIEQNKRKK